MSEIFGIFECCTSIGYCVDCCNDIYTYFIENKSDQISENGPIYQKMNDIKN